MFDPPATPTFPAGHAVQSYLISYLLAYSMANDHGGTRLPQHQLPDPTAAGANLAAAAGALFDLAARVSQNRIVAGVHFPTDIDAGKAIAIQTFTDLRSVASVWGLPAVQGQPAQPGTEAGGSG